MERYFRSRGQNLILRGTSYVCSTEYRGHGRVMVVWQNWLQMKWGMMTKEIPVSEQENWREGREGGGGGHGSVYRLGAFFKLPTRWAAPLLILPSHPPPTQYNNPSQELCFFPPPSATSTLSPYSSVPSSSTYLTTLGRCTRNYLGQVNKRVRALPATNEDDCHCCALLWLRL